MTEGAARPPRRSVRIGATDLHVAPLAVGAWSWGDWRYWGYGESFGPKDVVDAFVASADAGLDLFDTAEVYGDGESEKILGWLLRKRGAPLAVATKFALLPGRDARTLPRALDASLRRLGLPRVDLYQIHWPDRAQASVDALMEGLARAALAGKARAVGVSNFSATEMREAHAALARRGVPLASNQVRYSLLDRAPEVDGVLDACRELGVTLLAYSPLSQGLLTGKYAPGRPPPSPRAGHAEFAEENLLAVAPLVAMLTEIGKAHGDARPEQVALAWLSERGAVPIAGAKTGDQARINAGALAVELGAGEVESLDRASSRWRAVRAAAPDRLHQRIMGIGRVGWRTAQRVATRTRQRWNPALGNAARVSRTKARGRPKRTAPSERLTRFASRKASASAPSSGATRVSLWCRRIIRSTSCASMAPWPGGRVPR